MKIRTKLLKGVFYCYATIAGYDYSFGAITEKGARRQIKDNVNKQIENGSLPHDLKLDFSPIEIIKKELAAPKISGNEHVIGYQKVRIDVNPIG